MRHRETVVFSCRPQTGKGFILEITLCLAEGLCKIKGNFLLIHATTIIIYSLHTGLTDIWACLILRSIVGYLKKAAVLIFIYFFFFVCGAVSIKGISLKLFFKETFCLFSVCIWCKLWESIYKYIEWYCPLPLYNRHLPGIMKDATFFERV